MAVDNYYDGAMKAVIEENKEWIDTTWNKINQKLLKKQ